jgi:hypothetical protein
MSNQINLKIGAIEQNAKNQAYLYLNRLTVSHIVAYTSQRSYRRCYINVRSLTIINWGNKMPKKGFKSITVKVEVYDYFFNEWLKVKDEYAIKKGIRSFSAYVTYLLAELVSEGKKRKSENKPF